MDEKKEKVLAQIVKILTLAKDQEGTHEGNVAKAKAAKLMAQHMIHESELDMSTKSASDVFEDEEGWEGLCDQGGKRQWVADLSSHIASTFDCKVWLSLMSEEGSIHFVGTQGDMETCLYFMDVVYAHIEKLARIECPKYSDYKKRNVFGQEAVREVAFRLLAMKQEMEKEIKKHYAGGSDLMIVKNDIVRDAFKELSIIRGLRTGRRSDVNSSNQGIKDAGRKAGKSAPLHKAIN